MGVKITVAELISTLDMDTSPFEKATKVAALGTAAIVAGVGLVVAGMKKAIDATVKWGDELDTLQDVTDLTNEQAAGLNILLRKHGVSADVAAKSFTFLNKNLMEFDGSLGSTGKSLKNYGIDVQDANGKLKTNAQLTEEIARRYTELAPGTDRVAFLTDVFGKSSLELNDALLELADKGLGSFIDKANKMGLALDADTIQKYKQSVEEMKLSWEAIWIFLGSKLLPVAQRVTEWITNEGIPALMDFVQNATSAFEEGGLGGLATFLDKGLAEIIEEADWQGWGEKFGDALAKAFSGGMSDLNSPMTVDAFGRAINEFFLAASGADKFGGWKNFFIEWDRQSRENAKAFWSGRYVEGSSAIYDFFNNLDKVAQDAVRRWGSNLYNTVAEWIRKIINSISNANFGMGVGSYPLYGSNSGSGSGGSGNRRANGGNVIGGQSYQVAEFYKPEVFTPSTGGRVDPWNNKELIAAIKSSKMDETVLADKIVTKLATVMG